MILSRVESSSDPISSAFSLCGDFGDMLDSRYDCVQRLKRRQRGLELRLRIEAEPSCATSAQGVAICISPGEPHVSDPKHSIS